MNFAQDKSEENVILRIEELIREKKYAEAEILANSLLIELIPKDIVEKLKESDFRDEIGLLSIRLLLYRIYRKWIEVLDVDKQTLYSQQTVVKQEYRSLEKSGKNDEDSQRKITSLKEKEKGLKQQATEKTQIGKSISSKRNSLKKILDEVLLELETLDLDNVQYFRVLKNIYIALGFIPKRARKFFYRLHELDPNDEECIWLLCDFVKNDKVELAQYLEKIRTLNPGNKKCRERLIRLYSERAKSSEDYFARQILKLKSEIRNINRRLILKKQDLAQKCRRNNNFEDAVRMEKEIIAIDPLNIKSRINLIRTYLELIADLENKEYEEKDVTGKRREKIEFYRNEISELEQIIRRLQPSRIDWRMSLVNLYENNGLTENARRLLEEILVLEPQNIACRVKLIQICRAQGQIEYEILLQEEIRRLEPNNVKCRYSLISIYEERGRKSEVIALTEELKGIRGRRRANAEDYSTSRECDKNIGAFSPDSMNSLNKELLAVNEKKETAEETITNSSRMNHFIYRIRCGEITLENFNEELENFNKESEKLPIGYMDILIAFSYVLFGKGKELAIPYIRRAKRTDISQSIKEKLAEIEEIAKRNDLSQKPIGIRYEVAGALLKGKENNKVVFGAGSGTGVVR